MSRASLRNILMIILVGTLFVFVSSCSSPEGNVADGQRWYRMHNCHGCHGEHGNDGRGHKIAGLEMGFHSFTKRLRNARTAVMPEYSEELISDQDAADILAFLKAQK
jgi:mono/diheme cytochrome c family protein